MATFLVTFTVMLLAVAGLSVGLLRGKPIKGSCGGMSAMTGESCDICGNDPQRCEERSNS